MKRLLLMIATLWVLSGMAGAQNNNNCPDQTNCQLPDSATQTSDSLDKVHVIVTEYTCPDGSVQKSCGGMDIFGPDFIGAGTVLTTPTVTEAIDHIVKPLVDSAVGALETAEASIFGAIGIVLLSPEELGGPGDTPSANDKLCCDENGKELAPAAGGAGKGKKPHGNTIGNQPAELYALIDANGKFLKWGVSQNATTRYSDAQLAGGTTVVVGRGTRDEMIALERALTESMPGSLNREPWAGSAQR